MSVSIRPAGPEDAGLIAAFVRELADYEKLSEQAIATPENFVAALFGPNPRVFCDVAEVDGAPAGFALWF